MDTAQPETQGKLAQLMALFSGGKTPTQTPTPTAPVNGLRDTSADSGVKEAIPGEAAPAAHAGGDGLMGALKNLLQFFQAKAGSASNDEKYKKAMDEAGVPEEDQGIPKQ